MAVDTRSKRASSVQILMPFTISPVTPDGTISQGDRQHIAFTYSGILAISIILAACRTLDVGYEDRSLTIASETRLFDIGYENRTVIVDCPS